jgi:hypothetical protein
MKQNLRIGRVRIISTQSRFFWVWSYGGSIMTNMLMNKVVSRVPAKKDRSATSMRLIATLSFMRASFAFL